MPLRKRDMVRISDLENIIRKDAIEAIYIGDTWTDEEIDAVENAIRLTTIGYNQFRQSTYRPDPSDLEDFHINGELQRAIDIGFKAAKDFMTQEMILLPMIEKAEEHYVNHRKHIGVFQQNPAKPLVYSGLCFLHLRLWRRFYLQADDLNGLVGMTKAFYEFGQLRYLEALTYSILALVVTREMQGCLHSVTKPIPRMRVDTDPSRIDSMESIRARDLEDKDNELQSSSEFESADELEVD